MARRWVKGAGLTGVGLMSGAAGLLSVAHVATRRWQRAPDRVAPEELQMPADTVEHLIEVSDGARIRVVETGPRPPGRPALPPIVLLHGITLSAAIWPYQLRSLAAAGHRVLAFDLRGHGRSATTSAPSKLTLDRLAADVEEVLGALDVRDAVLVGHSMGGMVALSMMDRDPALAAGKGRIASMALVATTASPARGRGLPALSELVAAGRPLIASGAGLASRLPGPTLPAVDLAFVLARITFGDTPSARQVLFTGEMTSGVPVRVSAELLLEILRFDGEGVLPTIRVPTTVVVGDRDVITPLAHAEALAAGIAGSELLVLRGCGHMVMLERPLDLDDAILRLSRRSRGNAVA